MFFEDFALGVVEHELFAGFLGAVLFEFFEWFEDGCFGWGFAGGGWAGDGDVEVEWLCPVVSVVVDVGVAEGGDGECAEGELGWEVWVELEVFGGLVDVVGDPGGEGVEGEVGCGDLVDDGEWFWPVGWVGWGGWCCIAGLIGG